MDQLFVKLTRFGLTLLGIFMVCCFAHGQQQQPKVLQRVLPPPTGGVAHVVNIQGSWMSNIKLLFNITQSDNTFAWLVKGRSMPGNGTISETNLKVHWTDSGQSFDATGTIAIGPDGNGKTITLSNGVIMEKLVSNNSSMEPLPADGGDPKNPKAPANITNMAGYWGSAEGFRLKMEQTGTQIRWTATAEGGKYSGVGGVSGDTFYTKWYESGKKGKTVNGRIPKIGANGRADVLEFDNGLVLRRTNPF